MGNHKKPNSSGNILMTRLGATAVKQVASRKEIVCDLRGSQRGLREGVEGIDLPTVVLFERRTASNYSGLVPELFGTNVSAMPSPYHGDVAQRSDVFVWGSTDRSLGLPKTDAAERTDDVAKDSGQQ